MGESGSGCTVTPIARHRLTGSGSLFSKMVLDKVDLILERVREGPKSVGIWLSPPFQRRGRQE